MPPPAINLINPKNIATIHKIIPARVHPFGSPSFDWDNVRILINNPIIANGIFIQLRKPKHGIKPIIIPIIDKIPKIKLVVFTVLIVKLFLN